MKLFEGLRKVRQSGHLSNRAMQAFHGLRCVLDDEDRVTSGLVSVIDDSLQAIRLSGKNGDAYVLLANGLALGSSVLAVRRPDLARRLLDAAGAAIHAWWSLPHRGYPITKNVQTGEKLREQICESAVRILAVPPPGVDAYLKDCHDRLWQNMVTGQAVQRLVRELQARPKKAQATARPKKAQARAGGSGSDVSAQDMALARSLAEANGASAELASEMAQAAVSLGYEIAARMLKMMLDPELNAAVADKPKAAQIMWEGIDELHAKLVMIGVLHSCAAGVRYYDTDAEAAAALRAAFMRGFPGPSSAVEGPLEGRWDPSARPARTGQEDGIPAYEGVPLRREWGLLTAMAVAHGVPTELTWRLVSEAAVVLDRISRGFYETRDALLAARDASPSRRQEIGRAMFSNAVADVMFAMLSACALGVELSIRDRESLQRLVSTVDPGGSPP